MRPHNYTVAGHTFTVCLPDSEETIVLSSYEPFAIDAVAPDATKLFTLVVDDAFYPAMKGETIGEFDCGAADFGVYRLPDY